MIELRPNFRVKLQLWDTAGQEKFRGVSLHLTTAPLASF
ncbi:unnamed protein product [Nippostrongylus brasiliensis]|uniref:Ras-related protein Rab-21 n=1 Tax=Nippostrongylus brasiliensis TaxID=27835 RepID=A0A0N4YYZ8_NIPBR|nr:unnamed protein product [Nippostrongylus brasiliensis]